jgi:hypothetical protein
VSADSERLYRIHGLLVSSEIELDAQEATPGSRHEPIDYRIIARPPREVPHEPPPGATLAELRSQGFGYWVSERRAHGETAWTVRYAGLCDFELEPQRRLITVLPAPDTAPGMISIGVGGSVLAHALALEGRLVLHASAVGWAGRAIAIAAPSGGGKSTLACLLCGAGASLVADDVLRCDLADGRPICYPGTRSIRLRSGAASLAGNVTGGRVSPTSDGRTAVTPRDVIEAPIEVGAVLVLSPDSDPAATISLERLSAKDALIELIRHPRLGEWRAIEPIRQLFEESAAFSEAAPVLRAGLPAGPPFRDGLGPELLRSVEAKLSQAI